MGRDDDKHKVRKRSKSRSRHRRSRSGSSSSSYERKYHSHRKKRSGHRHKDKHKSKSRSRSHSKRREKESRKSQKEGRDLKSEAETDHDLHKRKHSQKEHSHRKSGSPLKDESSQKSKNINKRNSLGGEISRGYSSRNYHRKVGYEDYHSRIRYEYPPPFYPPMIDYGSYRSTRPLQKDRYVHGHGPPMGVGGGMGMMHMHIPHAQPPPYMMSHPQRQREAPQPYGYGHEKESQERKEEGQKAEREKEKERERERERKANEAKREERETEKDSEMKKDTRTNAGSERREKESSDSVNKKEEQTHTENSGMKSAPNIQRTESEQNTYGTFPQQNMGMHHYGSYHRYHRPYPRIYYPEGRPPYLPPRNFYPPPPFMGYAKPPYYYDYNPKAMPDRPFPSDKYRRDIDDDALNKMKEFEGDDDIVQKEKKEKTKEEERTGFSQTNISQMCELENDNSLKYRNIRLREEYLDPKLSTLLKQLVDLKAKEQISMDNVIKRSFTLTPLQRMQELEKEDLMVNTKSDKSEERRLVMQEILTHLE